MVRFTCIHVGVVINSVLIQENIGLSYASPPVEEKVVDEPEEDNVVGQVCMVY